MLHVMSELLLFASPSVPVSVDVTARRFQANASFLPDKTKLWKHPLAEDGWVHAHNAIRGELDVMQNVLDHIGRRPLQAWEASSLQAWWEGHVIHLHDHHENEDHKFSPYMATRINLPPKLTTDHVPLVRTLDLLGARIGTLREGASVTSLRRQWSKYVATMKPHLIEEERVALPLLRAYFTPPEVGKLVEQILGGAPPVSLGSFFYFMGGTREACARFMANEGIPFFVWYLAFAGHVATYHDLMVRHTDALLAGVPPPVAASAAPSPVAIAALTILAVAAAAVAHRRLAHRRTARAAGLVSVRYSASKGTATVATPSSPAHKTFSAARRLARQAGCPATPKAQGAFKARWPAPAC